MELLGSFFFIFPRPILSKLIEEREEGTYTKAYFELDSGVEAESTRHPAIHFSR